jgi:hypothetical protein
MLFEAHRMLPNLHTRRAVLLTLRRPPQQPAGPAAAERMPPPGGPGDTPVTSERTPK